MGPYEFKITQSRQWPMMTRGVIFRNGLAMLDVVPSIDGSSGAISTNLPTLDDFQAFGDLIANGLNASERAANALR